MSNIAYETLGRATWAYGKHRAKNYLVPAKGNRVKRGFIVFSVVAVGVVVVGAALERASAQ